MNSKQRRTDRVNPVFLRAIGRMSLASCDLEAQRARLEAGSEALSSWSAFADQLIEGAQAVREGACASNFAGNTIALVRQGTRVPVDVDYVDRLSDKIQHHVRVGQAIGIGESDERSAPVLTA